MEEVRSGPKEAPGWANESLYLANWIRQKPQDGWKSTSQSGQGWPNDSPDWVETLGQAEEAPGLVKELPWKA